MSKIISLESTREGAGKTTIASLIVMALETKGIEAKYIKLPDGKFRELLLSEQLDPISHLLVQAANFRNIVETEIKPALTDNKFVILDRWIDSCYAYQGFGSGIDIGQVNDILEFAVGSYKPNLTILLDVPKAVAKARVSQRGEQTRVAERAGTEYEDRVCAGYLSMASTFTHRIKLIDANRDLGKVLVDVMEHII